MDEVVLVGAALAQWAVTGALLARRSRHPVTVALTVMSAALVVQLLAPVGETVAAALWVLGPPMLAVLLVVFPDGARGRGWAWVLRYQVVVLAFCLVAEAMWPGDGGPAGADRRRPRRRGCPGGRVCRRASAHPGPRRPAAGHPVAAGAVDL